MSPRSLPPLVAGCLTLLCLHVQAYPRPNLDPPGLPPYQDDSPLPEAVRRQVAAIPEDPPPAALVRNAHYVVSNEPRQDLFRDQIKGRGGIYIGVGSDQNYLLAAWARPDLMVLMDFDAVVVNVHRAHRAFFLHADSPRSFLDLWDGRHEDLAQQILRSEYPERVLQAAVLRAYKAARDEMPKRLGIVLRACSRHGVRSYLDDAEQYRYLAGMYRAGRVVLVRGDLTAGGTLSAVAAAARSLGAQVRLLYLSNAERYFNYTDGFRSSVTALPAAEESVVLRTRARRDGSYEYLAQSLLDFQGWAAQPNIRKSVQFVRLREPAYGEAEAHKRDAADLFVIKALPRAGRP